METKEFPSIYPYSYAEAKRLKELGNWKESHKENIACRNTIEEAIHRDFDGRHLSADCAKSIIEQFGYHRTAFVLANSLQQKDFDGRFSHSNHDWAKRTYIPTNKDVNGADLNVQFTVNSHPAVLDGFVNQFHKAYQELGLFDYTHCLPDTSKQDFEEKVIVLSADTLRESHLTQQNQLWLCTGGFGSHADSNGRAVFVTCLDDGEKTRMNRNDFAGVLAEANLPDWAREKLEQLQSKQQTADDTPDMGGMTMQ